MSSSSDELKQKVAELEEWHRRRGNDIIDLHYRIGRLEAAIREIGNTLEAAAEKCAVIVHRVLENDK